MILSKALFATTDFQQTWIKKLEAMRSQIESTARDNDESGTFPTNHIQTLVDSGYTTLPIPESLGGSSLSIADLVLLQETLGSMDGATALSISWHQSVVAEIYEKRKWSKEQLSFLAKEVL